MSDSLISNGFSENLAGNGPLKLYLENQLEAGRLPHALIFEGPEGSGKHTAARLTSEALAKKNSEPRLAEKIRNGVSPDVLTFGLTGERKSIGVDTVRAIKEEAYLSPNELDFKAFILEDAQLMTPAAQNALLKLLEEPPANVYFLILCENTATLLTTVRSRAPILRLQVFEDAELSSLLAQNDKKAADLAKAQPEQLERLIRSSHGSYGKALNELKKSSRKKSADGELERRIITALREKSKASLISLLTELPQKREDTAELADSLTRAFRDMICAKYGISGTLMFCDSDEDAAALSDGFSLASVMRLCGALENTVNELSRNANLYTAQVNMLLRLYGAQVFDR